MKRKKKRTTYIPFADGGWIEFDPCGKELVSSGDDWNHQVLLERKAKPECLYRAVKVATLVMMGEG